MKNVILLLCLFISQECLSQSGNSPRDPNGRDIGVFRGTNHVFVGINSSPAGNVGSMYSESAKYNYENAKLDGSQYLFEQWKNQGVILVGDKKYVIPNINFNMDKQVFMSKFEDSVLVYDFQRIDKVLVNGKLFKSIYNASEGKKKIYEILYSGEDFSVFKEHYISIQEASPNPMLNRPNRKIRQKSTYYVYNKGEFSSLKLKKANLLSLLSSDDTKKLETYAEINKLSYKKAEDVDRMLAHINK